MNVNSPFCGMRLTDRGLKWLIRIFPIAALGPLGLMLNIVVYVGIALSILREIG